MTIPGDYHRRWRESVRQMREAIRLEEVERADAEDARRNNERAQEDERREDIALELVRELPISQDDARDWLPFCRAIVDLIEERTEA